MPDEELLPPKPRWRGRIHLAAFLISIPAGMMVERCGARAILLAAFGLNLLGAVAIALLPSYLVVIGGLRDNGAPGTRAEYSAGYYAAFLIDPDGNNVEAVVSPR